MPQLRWTLLILGVLFVVLLGWIERRRQHRGFLDQGPVEHDGAASQTFGGQSSGAAENTSQPVFREPTLNLPEMRARDPIAPHELPVVEIEDDESLTARRVEPKPSPAVNPPTLSLPVIESGPAKRERPDPSAVSGSQWIRPSGEPLPVPRLDTPAVKHAVPKVEPRFETSSAPLEAHDDGEAERAFNEAVFGDASVEPGNETDMELAAQISAAKAATDEEGEATIAQDGRAEPEAEAQPAEPPAPLFTAADVTPIKDPVVDWPPDDRRKVVALRLVALPPERLAGRALRLALASEGFVLGKFQIFHKADGSGRAVLSAANLSKPGTFDVETMDSQRFGGLSLFAVLPGPKPPLKAFEDLLSTARNLNERLQGALQDERGGPLTPTRIAALRESVGTEVPS